MNYEILDPQEKAEPHGSPEQPEAGVLQEILGSGELLRKSPETVENIIGEPEDVENWHVQGESMSCAVSIQEIIAEQMFDKEFAEKDVIEFAKEKGWYDPETGTTYDDVGKVLEAVGLNVERSLDVTVAQLIQALAQGDKVICAVNNMNLLFPILGKIPGRMANHVVQVVGIDFTDPEDPQVILNDTGVPNGQGIRHDLDVFLNAWKTSCNYAVFVSKGDAGK